MVIVMFAVALFIVIIAVADVKSTTKSNSAKGKTLVMVRKLLMMLRRGSYHTFVVQDGSIGRGALAVRC